MAAAQPPWPSSSAGTSRVSPCGAAPRSSPSFSVRGCAAADGGGSGTVRGWGEDGAAGRPLARQHGRRRGGAARPPHAQHLLPTPLSLPRVAAYGINSILYQRGIYPPETFTRVQKYGLTLLVTTDPELKNYLNNVVEQMKGGGERGVGGWASSNCQASAAGGRLLCPPCCVSGDASCLSRTASNRCGFFQSGCTSALCSAWWWSSRVSKTTRFWSGGSLT